MNIGKLTTITTKKYLIGLTIIISLPLILSLKLLITGEKTYGSVIGEKKKYTMRGSYTYSVISFTTNKNKDYELFGPSNIIYPRGKKIPIYYNKANPNQNMIYRLDGIYISPKGALSLVLLIIWSGIFSASYITEKDKDIS